MQVPEFFHRLRFNWAVRAIADTPPLVPGATDFIALSMVQHRDVLPYLLAIKSFARFLSPARVVLIADPTLDARDRMLIHRHVPHIEFREAAEFHRAGIPQGGTWERLTAISEYAQDHYVVQLDADTVTLQDLVAVRQAIRDRVSFTLGTEDVQPIVGCAEIAAWARPRLNDQAHAQLLAEASLDRFDPAGHYRYARGCSGFAGFAAGSVTPSAVRTVSERMAELLGAKWSAWGTEQFTSNLLVCSSAGARLLPHPHYCNPGRKTAATVFLHFIGYVRFQSDLYAKLAQQVAHELQLAPPGREAAYTTERPDVCAMVPASARHILDVGCSNGALARSLKEVQPERSVSGIEFDLGFAQEARKHLDQVIHADLNQLDWREGFGGRRFDCIIFADVLEHLLEPQRCLLQARQYLHPGGCVVVSVPNIRHLSALHAIAVEGRFPRRNRGLFDRTHLRWFTVADALGLISECGLRVSDMSPTLRWGDRGGGRANRWLNRLPLAVQRWGPVREFLTYQMCLRAEIAP